jgi:hypothetical protein
MEDKHQNHDTENKCRSKNSAYNEANDSPFAFVSNFSVPAPQRLGHSASQPKEPCSQNESGFSLNLRAWCNRVPAKLWL